MTYDPDKHHRRSIRLKGYDYSQSGAYFITICTQDRVCLFGEVVDGEMRLNDAGQIAEQSWRAMPDHFPHVRLDEFLIMPNHVHGILWIVDSVGASVGANNHSPLQYSPRGTSKTVGSVVRGFKIGVTKWMRQNHLDAPVWQRNYYEHIIRNDESLNSIREYIINNPLQWELDRENPNIVKAGLKPAPTEDEPWRI